MRRHLPQQFHLLEIIKIPAAAISALGNGQLVWLVQIYRPGNVLVRAFSEYLCQRSGYKIAQMFQNQSYPSFNKFVNRNFRYLFSRIYVQI
jgi:hypothetical protein